MDRTNFYNIVTINGLKEFDHLDNTLSKFTMTYPVQYYRVMGEDVMRPDLISYKAYNTVKYWWLVCLVNKIQNPLNDLEVGDQLKLPHILDIFSFYKRYAYR